VDAVVAEVEAEKAEAEVRLLLRCCCCCCCCWLPRCSAVSVQLVAQAGLAACRAGPFDVLLTPCCWCCASQAAKRGGQGAAGGSS
jgi:hypothetical protein